MGLPEIIFEDPYILAINKPAGLLSIRDGYNSALPHAASLLQPQFGRLWIVHRLDRDTSGILLLARTKEAHRHLNQQFENRAVKKTYHAFVAGIPDWEEKQIELALLVNGDRSHRTVVSPSGKPASTACQVLKRYFAGYTLVTAQPFSGYTHQIRVHLAAVGFPILGDPLYQPIQAGFPSPIARLALHAAQITFIHPLTQLSLSLNAPYPADFNSLAAGS